MLPTANFAHEPTRPSDHQDTLTRIFQDSRDEDEEEKLIRRENDESTRNNWPNHRKTKRPPAHENLSRRGEEHFKHKKLAAKKLKLMKASELLLSLLLIYILGSSTTNKRHQNDPQATFQRPKQAQQQLAQFVLVADAAVALECENETDCDGNGEKICHENKCICHKDRPIESGGFCLPTSLIDEPCQADGQCLGGSHCIEGVCSCGANSISQMNPSQQIYYCHPKRQLDESCNYDAQCPANAYCSTGCLCQNGFAPALVKAADGSETTTCLPVTCSHVSQCESSEFYKCEDNKCICMPTHFDPTRAKCYRLGSLGAGLDDEAAAKAKNASTDDQLERQRQPPGGGGDGLLTPISFFINDLIEATTGRADLFWLLVGLFLLSLLFLLAILCCHCCSGGRDSTDDNDNSGRRRPPRTHHLLLPCCWIAHKHQAWDPADAKATPPDGAAFLHDDGLSRKASVNQKSFRRKKNPDAEQESAEEFVADDDTLAGSDNKQQKSSLLLHANNKSHISKQNASKTNDYEVIYFGSTKTKQVELNNNNEDRLLIEPNDGAKDDQLRINLMMNGDAGKSPFKHKPLIKQQQQPHCNNNNLSGAPQDNGKLSQEEQLGQVVVPTNSTLV